MRTARTLTALALSVAYPSMSLNAADDLESLKRQNAELKSRLESVEQDLAKLKSLLSPPATPSVAPPPTTAATPGFTPAETEKLKEIAAIKGKPARSSLDLSFYGYVKLDAAYDDSRTSLGNFARWAETESLLANDDQFSLTANQTRLGIDLSGPSSKTLTSTGKVEFDLYGAGAGENRPEPMLRHAYLRLDWPQHKFAVLAGQSWDIISPLNPITVNYSVAWWQGNIGYRRPQLRLAKSFDLADRLELKLDAGVTRTITGRRVYFRESTDPDTGGDAGYPTLAGRAGLSIPISSKNVATFGLSGHHGTEEFHRPDLSDHDSYNTWSLNADLRLPLGPKFLLQAEAFTGRNLDSYLGGIGQGINTTLNQEIDTVGGWLALTSTPWTDWQFNLGASIEDPEDEDLTGNVTPAQDARIKNCLLFANVLYSLTTQVQLAYELSWLRTNYKLNAPGEGWRQHFAITYKF